MLEPMSPDGNSKGLRMTEVDSIPPLRKGPRQSRMLNAYLAAKESRTKKIRFDGEAKEVDRFYRSLMQWQRRHPEAGINIRKDGDSVFVWLDS
jgi:hypothetical protein